MKIFPVLKRLLSVFGAAVALSTASAALPYTDGDLILGVHATAGVGGGASYVINIGSVSNFANATSATTISGLGNVAADLESQFGPNWKTRADVAWGIFGVALSSDTPNTLYASRPEPTPGVLATPWKGDSPSGQSSTASKINAVIGAYTASAANGASTNGVLQDSAINNSYHSSQPAPNTGRISFTAFNPTIEGNFASASGGTAGSVIDLFKVAPVFDQAATRLGYFQFSDSGALTFIPSTIAIVRIQQGQATAAETAGTIPFTVTRGGVTSSIVTVNFATGGGSAVAGSDYTTTSTTLTFQAGQTSKVVDVPIIDRDGFYQGDKTFNVALTSASNNASIIAFATATAKITETDPAPPGDLGFTAASFTVPSLTGAGSPNIATVTVTRTGGSAGQVSADVTFGGSLVNGTDYQTITSPKTVTFEEGETTQTFDITLNTIPAGSLPGTITLTLGNFVGAGQGAITSTTLNIVSAGALAFSTSDYQGSELNGTDVTVPVTLTRTGGDTGAVSVTVASTPSTATLGDDFTLPATQVVTWASGDSAPKTFNITIKADALVEQAETIALVLQNVTGGATIGTQSTATVTILDLDTAPPTITLTTPKPKTKISGTNVSFSGNAKDTQGVARVEIKFNGVLAATATPSSATTNYNWTATATPEQGLNNVTVTAFDLAGNSTPITTTLTFTNVRPELAGAYNGLVVATPANSPLTPIFRNGLLNVVVTKTGSFTGKVFIGGTTLPLRGVIGSSGAARFGKTADASFDLTVKGSTPTAIGKLVFTVDTVSALKITGNITSNNTAIANIPQADRAVYNKKTNPVPTSVLNPAQEKGKYTAIFQADSSNTGSTNTYPQGDGFGSITVSPAGVVKIVGKLADGTPVSYSNALSTDRNWPLFVQIYSKKGFISGLVTFDDTQALSDASAQDVKWLKPAGLPKQKLYPNGWADTITTDFFASKFVAPGKPGNTGTVLGSGVTGAASATTANIVVTVADGGLASAVATDASLDAKSKVTPIGATNGLKAKFVATTGAFSGSFTHPGTNKAVSYTGVAFQKTNTASGYFLYTPATGTAESGAAGVAKK